MVAYTQKRAWDSQQVIGYLHAIVSNWEGCSSVTDGKLDFIICYVCEQKL